MKTRLVCVLAAIVMHAAFAYYQTEVVDGVEWKYIIEGGKAYLYSSPSSGSIPGETTIPVGTAGDLVVPSMLGGCPVVSIPDGAFFQCREITSLFIPDSVTHIGGSIARWCSKLEKISIGKGITSVPAYAFSVKLYWGDVTSMKSIVIRGGWISCSSGGGYYLTDRTAGVKVYVSKDWTLPARWDEYDVEYYTDYDATFDLGSHGQLVSGELTQKVVKDWWATIPKFTVASEWVFDGWNPSPSEPVTSNTTYVATYRQIQCEKPAISPDEGTFAEVSQEVSLSCEAGGKMYYTLDGTDPSEENGRLYKAPFSIYKTTTVKAVTVKPDLLDSAIVSSNYTREDSIGEAANLLQYLMENDETYPWTVDASVSHDGVSSIKSGGAGVRSVVSGVTTSVKRAGTVTFWWKADCEEPEEGEYYDYIAFIVDDDVVERLAGKDTAWQKFSYSIPTAGKHVLCWEYRKDGATSRYSDCAWVDQIEWIPEDGSGCTVTTPTPVPYSWLQNYGYGKETDFETEANGKSGKTQGGRDTAVWEEFWVGTDPTNVASVLTAYIEFVGGAPKVSWKPDWNEGGKLELRSYTVWGKEKLDDEQWVSPTNSLHRFFRVSIEMP